MNKSESKYYNTAQKMDEALLTLLDTKSFDYITVKDICTVAGVNRSTFYLHYETIIDLLDETVEHISRKFYSYFENTEFDIQQINSMPLEELYLITPQYLMPWLQFTKDNKKLFSTFFKRSKTLRVIDSYEQIFKDVLSPILSRFNVKKENQPYIMLFYVEGIGGIVKEWIRNDCSREVSDIAEMIMSCIQKHEKER